MLDTTTPWQNQMWYVQNKHVPTGQYHWHSSNPNPVTLHAAWQERNLPDSDAPNQITVLDSNDNNYWKYMKSHPQNISSMQVLNEWLQQSNGVNLTRLQLQILLVATVVSLGLAELGDSMVRFLENQFLGPTSLASGATKHSIRMTKGNIRRTSILWKTRELVKFVPAELNFMQTQMSPYLKKVANKNIWASHLNAQKQNVARQDKCCKHVHLAP